MRSDSLSHSHRRKISSLQEHLHSDRLRLDAFGACGVCEAAEGVRIGSAASPDAYSRPVDDDDA